jgi:hypothetical protein
MTREEYEVELLKKHWGLYLADVNVLKGQTIKNEVLWASYFFGTTIIIEDSELRKLGEKHNMKPQCFVGG